MRVVSCVRIVARVLLVLDTRFPLPVTVSRLLTTMPDFGIKVPVAILEKMPDVTIITVAPIYAGCEGYPRDTRFPHCIDSAGCTMIPESFVIVADSSSSGTDSRPAGVKPVTIGAIDKIVMIQSTHTTGNDGINSFHPLIEIIVTHVTFLTIRVGGTIETIGL
jgi:hypothetical protein